ncbi:MAG: sugar phosphate isomerase/epimerase family protein [Candidatus Methylomirabilota bacterium]
MDRIVSVSTMAFDGYPLETALDELAALGVKHVEPASVDKVFQHLVEEDFCPARANRLRRELGERGLSCLSLSAHMDLTRPDSVERFQRRLEFARNLGARCVNSIAGPAEHLDGFRRNLPAIAERAKDLGVVIALENHGDLLDRGLQILEFIREIGHPAVRVNYDTGNAWYYSRGAIDPVEELALLAPVAAHVHLKSPKIVDGLLCWAALGDGVLDLPRLARVLMERMPGVPVSYELSPRQRSRDFEPRWRAPEIPRLQEIRALVAESLTALGRLLGTS